MAYLNHRVQNVAVVVVEMLVALNQLGIEAVEQTEGAHPFVVEDQVVEGLGLDMAAYQRQVVWP